MSKNTQLEILSTIRYRGLFDATHNATNTIASPDFALPGFTHRIAKLSEGSFEGAEKDQVQTVIVFESDKAGFADAVAKFLKANFPSVMVG